MKIFFLIIVASFIIPSSLLADQCGVLDFGTDVAWEYRKGIFFDIDGRKISVAVPAKRKTSQKNASAVATIQAIGSSKSKGVPPALHFSIKPSKGRIIQLTKRGRNLIALFEGSSSGSNLLLLNIADGSVSRATIKDTLLKKKIVFVPDEEASFYTDDCSEFQ